MPSSTSPATPLTIHPTPLTATSFSPFGTVISAPFPLSHNATTTTTIPTPPPPPFISANQHTALKASPISPLINAYPNPSQPVLSLFACFPRALEPTSTSTSTSPSTSPSKANTSNSNSNTNAVFPIEILERHPYTTQTFIPLGLAPEDISSKYLVIVAPTLPAGDGAPDLEHIKAFWAHGGQGITYGVGTWHAPMVVLGGRRVDFVVLQFGNGVEADECVEWEVGEGGEGVVEVDVGGGCGRWWGEGEVVRGEER